ncbi:MAG: dihydroxyacetone kinase subunit L [Rhodospirillaceae bacterium]|jgi:dihydroxyacetone kinase-like protein|nr:dihydroxyacetone kinase subunit L [Rhodospirillaceae bacterium]
MQDAVSLRAALVKAVAEVVGSHADELTALDQAIGDGDHGINMKRGFEAVAADAAALCAKPWPDFLKSVGTTLVMKVGGASGPLYGTLFMAMGKEMPENPTAADLPRAFRAAILAVQARGKAERGHKTMLDVLIPVAEALESGIYETDKIAAAAHAAAEATKPIKAVRGRASFLGDRSIGHMDPGARSSALLIEAVSGILENE